MPLSVYFSVIAYFLSLSLALFDGGWKQAISSNLQEISPAPTDLTIENET